MTKATINNEINLEYADSFKEMGEEELTRYFGAAADRWGVYDADRHIIVSVGWTKAKLLQKLTDSESVLTGIISRMKRRLLNYQQLASYEIKLGKKKANGVRFEYRVNDSVMVQTADVIVFKNKGKFYVIYFIARKAHVDEYRPEFQELLKSVTLS